jgi:hypothetical protein
MRANSMNFMPGASFSIKPFSPLFEVNFQISIRLFCETSGINSHGYQNRPIAFFSALKIGLTEIPAQCSRT